MATFTVWEFEDQDGAERAASILRRLEADHLEAIRSQVREGTSALVVITGRGVSTGSPSTSTACTGR